MTDKSNHNSSSSDKKVILPDSINEKSEVDIFNIKSKEQYKNALKTHQNLMSEHSDFVSLDQLDGKSLKQKTKILKDRSKNTVTEAVLMYLEDAEKIYLDSYVTPKNCRNISKFISKQLEDTSKGIAPSQTQRDVTLKRRLGDCDEFLKNPIGKNSSVKSNNFKSDISSQGMFCWSDILNGGTAFGSNWLAKLPDGGFGCFKGQHTLGIRTSLFRNGVAFIDPESKNILFDESDYNAIPNFDYIKFTEDYLETLKKTDEKTKITLYNLTKNGMKHMCGKNPTKENFYVLYRIETAICKFNISDGDSESNNVLHRIEGENQQPQSDIDQNQLDFDNILGIEEHNNLLVKSSKSLCKSYEKYKQPDSLKKTSGAVQPETRYFQPFKPDIDAKDKGEFNGAFYEYNRSLCCTCFDPEWGKVKTIKDLKPDEKLFDTTSRDCIIDSVDGKGTKKWIVKYKKSVAKGTKGLTQKDANDYKLSRNKKFLKITNEFATTNEKVADNNKHDIIFFQSDLHLEKIRNLAIKYCNKIIKEYNATIEDENDKYTPLEYESIKNKRLIHPFGELLFPSLLKIFYFIGEQDRLWDMDSYEDVIKHLADVAEDFINSIEGGELDGIWKERVYKKDEELFQQELKSHCGSRLLLALSGRTDLTGTHTLLELYDKLLVKRAISYKKKVKTEGAIIGRRIVDSFLGGNPNMVGGNTGFLGEDGTGNRCSVNFSSNGNVNFTDAEIQGSHENLEDNENFEEIGPGPNCRKVTIQPRHQNLTNKKSFHGFYRSLAETLKSSDDIRSQSPKSLEETHGEEKANMIIMEANNGSLAVNSHLKVHGYDEYLEGKITSDFLYERRKKIEEHIKLTSCVKTDHLDDKQVYEFTKVEYNMWECEDEKLHESIKKFQQFCSVHGIL